MITKNILIIAQRVPYPPNKGEKIRTFHQIEWLCKRGFGVTVACPISDECEWQNLKALQAQLGVEILGVPLSSRVTRYLRALTSGVSFSEANFYSSKLESTLVDIVGRGDFRFVMLTASSLLPYTERLNLPLLVDFMDLDSDKWLQYASRSRFPMNLVYNRESKKVAQLEKSASERAHACFFIAQPEIELFSNRVSADNIYRLGNGIDTNTFFPSSAGLRDNISQDPVLLFVGAMDYLPNVDAMIWFVEEFWSDIRLKYPQAQLIIGGMNPTRAISNLANVPGVEVTGFVSDIVPFFHRADIFVAPFRLARGVQNKVLQAFACGIPTISTTVGVEGIDCESGKQFLCADNPETFVKAIEELVEDNGLRDTLAKYSLDLIKKKYSWDAQLAVLGELVDVLNFEENGF